MYLFKITLLFLSILFFSVSPAQNLKRTDLQKHPVSFTISKTTFDRLFSFKEDALIDEKTNKYLDQSLLVLNTLNGDMKFLKLKLKYFDNAFLVIQVNGAFTTQIFIMSDDKSVFYKGSFGNNNNIVMTKCYEDDIVSE